MTTEILNGRPPQPADEALIKAYHDAIIKQADLYVDLAKELLKLELAIPGIYAAALKLVTSQSPCVSLVAAAFGFWLLALVATLRVLFPRRYEVLHDAVQSVGRAGSDGALTIEDSCNKVPRTSSGCYCGLSRCSLSALSLPPRRC